MKAWLLEPLAAVSLGASLAVLQFTFEAIAYQQPSPHVVQTYSQKVKVREIRVNLAGRSASIYEDGALIKSYPVGIGSVETPTPKGEFSVLEKEVNPTYTDGVNSVPPGPNNPLGSRWIGFFTANGGSWGFHAGRIDSSSLGCLRMKEADVQEFYSLVSVGDKVIIQ